MAPKPAAGGSVTEVARVFLRIGLTAFGGPAAHIALMEAELVERRRWISRERFLDLLGAANLLPGPSSTELAIFLGYDRAGLGGLVAAGACFIVPVATLVLGVAWAYVRFGTLPAMQSALYGVKPVIVAVIVQALRGLGPKALRSWPTVVVAGGAVLAAWVGANPLWVLLGAGALVMGITRASAGARLLAALPLGAPAAGVTKLGAIFLSFLKMGAVVFGSGYVLVAFLRDEVVVRRQWVDERVLLDAVAVGQLTPGPVFTTATFLGYVIAGVPGAALATVGIFLPGFFLVALARPVLARVRRSPTASAFLDGVNAASVALMAVVTVHLARAAIVDLPTALVGLGATVLLLATKVNPTWLVLAGALVGVVRSFRP